MSRSEATIAEDGDTKQSSANPPSPQHQSTKYTEKFGLQPRYAFSANALTKRTFQFIDNGTIVFPIGRHLWTCATAKKQMNFMARRSSSSSPFVRVSGDRKRLLVAETIDGGAKKPQLSFYDISGSSHQLLWHFSHNARGTITACDISNDGKVVVCVIKYSEGHGRKASGIVCLWKAENKKFIAGKEVQCDISHLTINPEDSYLICVAGYKYLRYLKCVGNSLDEVPLLKRHKERSYTFLDHVWVNSEVLACLTETSAVCVFVKGDLKQKIPRKEVQILVAGKDSSGGNIDCIEAINDGFILGTSDGYILFYTLDKARNFKFVKEFDTGKGKEIADLAISPSKDLLAVAIKDYGLVTFPCGRVGWGDDDEIQFTDCIMPCGNTVALDCSEQRQILVTTSLDNVVRVFENIRDSQEVVQSRLQHAFDEVPLAVAVHPNGLSLVLVFSKYLAYYHVLRDDLKESFVFHLQVPIVKPLTIKYAHEGHKLAVCTGQHMFIFSALDFSLLQYIFVQRPVRTFCWSRDDLYIAVATLDGAIYTWELETLMKVQECVDKGLKYEDIVMDWGIEWRFKENLCKSANAPKRQHLLADHQDSGSLNMFLQRTEASEKVEGESTSSKQKQKGRHSRATNMAEQAIIAAGSGAHHKLVHVKTGGEVMDLKTDESDSKDGGEVSESDFRKMVVTQLVLDTSRNVLIAGTQAGYILLLAYPFGTARVVNDSLTDCYARYAIHDGPVTHLKLMEDHGVLFSNGADGNLFLLDLGVMGANGQFQIRHQRKVKKKTEESMLRIGNALRGNFSTDLNASLREDRNDWQEEIYAGDLSVVQVLQSEYDEVIRRAKEHELELKQLQTQAAFQFKTAKDHHVEEMRLLRGDMEMILEKKKNEVDVHKAKIHQHSLMHEKLAREAKELLDSTKFQISEDYEVKLHQQFQITEQYKRRLEALQEVLVRDKAQHEEKVAVLKEEHEVKWAENLEAQAEKIKELEYEKQQQQKEYEEVIRQMEEEHGVEVAWLETEADEKLRTTRETTAIARARYTTMASKFEGNQNTLTTLRALNNEQDELLKKREQQISSLKVEIKSGKTESKMKEVELTRRQHDLANARKSSTVLQNFIGVLEHRITELEEREQPTQRFLQKLQDQIEDMSEEFFEQTQAQQKLKHFAQKKGGEAARLNSTVARVQHDLSRQEKRWTHVVKELKHIVQHTPVAEWEGALRTFYDDYIAAYSHTVDEDDRGVQNKVYNVLDRQRRHLEHSLNQMKRSVKHIDKRRNVETEKAVQRNTLFLAEVNELREQNKKLEQRCKKYMSMALVTNDVASSSIDAGRGQSRGKSREKLLGGNSADKSASRRSLRSSESLRTASRDKTSDTWEYKPRSKQVNPYQRRIRGSTKPLSAVSELKRKLHYAQNELENAHQQMSLQKVEISHLQEGVNVALDLAHTNFSQYTMDQIDQVASVSDKFSSDDRDMATLKTRETVAPAAWEDDSELATTGFSEADFKEADMPMFDTRRVRTPSASAAKLPTLEQKKKPKKSMKKSVSAAHLSRSGPKKRQQHRI